VGARPGEIRPPNASASRCLVAAALLFAREGARVIVADLNEEDAQSTVADIGDANGEARFVRTDVSEAEDMRA
jgi:NAD(P)-dependent dehydrogenase (short-subunit alcohol dehydrogenase family)